MSSKRFSCTLRWSKAARKTRASVKTLGRISCVNQAASVDSDLSSVPVRRTWPAQSQAVSAAALQDTQQQQ